MKLHDKISKNMAFRIYFPLFAHDYTPVNDNKCVNLHRQYNNKE